jgi:hypothetical protein
MVTTDAINRVLEGDPDLLGVVVAQRETEMAMVTAKPTRDETLELLLIAFDTVIRPKLWRSTGSPALGYQGRFEDAERVHWTAWIDRQGSWLGVTMPGKQFRDWPIATFVLQERKEPQLLRVIRDLPRTSPIEMAWWRTVWQGSGRLPNHLDRNLTGDANDEWTRLTGLTTQSYRLILDEALKCLDESRGYRGRGSGDIRLMSGTVTTVTHGLTPEFQFRAPVDVTRNQEATNRAMEVAREVLRPLYEFVERRTSP